MELVRGKSLIWREIKSTIINNGLLTSLQCLPIMLDLLRRVVLCLNHGVGAGWSSLVARRAHNPKVVGSNPAPATNFLLN